MTIAYRYIELEDAKRMSLLKLGMLLDFAREVLSGPFGLDDLWSDDAVLRAIAVLLSDIRMSIESLEECIEDANEDGALALNSQSAPPPAQDNAALRRIEAVEAAHHFFSNVMPKMNVAASALDGDDFVTWNKAELAIRAAAGLPKP